MRTLVCLCLVFLAVTLAEKRRFDGYKVISAVPMTVEAGRALYALKKRFQLDFWLEPRKVNRPSHAMVAPHLYEPFLEALQAIPGLASVETIEHNVQTNIDREEADLAKARQTVAAGSFPLNQYHQLADIQKWLASLAQSKSSLASTVSFGSTTEGRKLTYIKIGGPAKGTAKPAFWLDCGIHAREWVSPATCNYVIDQLLNNASNAQLVAKVDFYVVPVLNPDGYVYTWSTNRMWRKTRTPYTKKSWFGSKTCYGADPNRNWANHFGGAGDGTDPCGDTYEGPAAFSEPSVKSASVMIASIKNLQAYFTLHSYSCDWFYPWSYASHTYPANIGEIRSVSQQAVKDMDAAHGKSFNAGTPADILYAAAANSMDWVKALKVRWAFAMELRPCGQGNGGFQLPAAQILDAASEAWAGIRDVALKVAA